MSELQAKVDELCQALEIPGVAVGIVHHVDGEWVEEYAFAGVTSIENPLPIDERTLMQFGSTGKTFTATAIMRLVEMGKVDLGATVRTYIPDLKLKDEHAAANVTVLQLLNHTAGWEGDLMEDQGDGDDALEKYLVRMQTIEQVTPLGAMVSYNNASLSLAGLLIARVMGTTYEKAMRELVLDPLGLDDTLFFPAEIMIRRFSVGHTRHDDGTTTITKPWPIPRSSAPAGGMSATAKDQVAWAKLHLGEVPEGFLRPETVQQMQEPTADMSGSALGEAVGISWLLDDIAGVKVVKHGGTTHGQHSAFQLIPERRFGIISMTNVGPTGPQFNDQVVKWAYEHYLGLVEPEPEPLELSEQELAPYTGHFETIAAHVEITPSGGRLSAQVSLREQAAQAMRDAGEEVEQQPPFVLAIIKGKPDRYVVAEGPAKGMRGYFTRAADGSVDAVNLGGRLATRV